MVSFMLSFEWYPERFPLNIFGIPRASSFLLLRVHDLHIAIKNKNHWMKVKAVCAWRLHKEFSSEAHVTNNLVL